jgi:hypothetical protein
MKMEWPGTVHQIPLYQVRILFSSHSNFDFFDPYICINLDPMTFNLLYKFVIFQ